MNQPLRSLRDSKYKLTVLILVGLMLCFCLPIIYLSLTGHAAYDLSPFYQAQVPDLRPCLGLDAATGQPIEIKEPFNVASTRLEVCARLEVDYIGGWRFQVPLYFLWRYEGKPLYASETRMYSPGYVTTSLEPDQDKPFSPGTYQVEVRARRTMYATTDLLVVSQR
jgi:hypothetical protein